MPGWEVGLVAAVILLVAAVVQNYRAARELAERQRRGEAGTEDLRKALVSYRGLFDELPEVQEMSR